MTAATVAAFAMLSIGAALLVVRLVRGPDLGDRVVAVDTLLLLIVAGIAVGAFTNGDGTYLDVLVVTSLLGFIGTTTASRFIETKADRRDQEGTP